MIQNDSGAIKRKAYKYIRYSTLEQSKGASFDRQNQNEKILRFCAENGYELEDEVLFDKGKSAYSAENLREGSALRKFKDRVLSGEIAPGSVLICESLDRLYRVKHRKSLEEIGAIIDAGVNVYFTLDDTLYTKDKLDDLGAYIYLTVKANLAHEESQKKSRRLTDVFGKMKAKALTGDGVYKNGFPLWLQLNSAKTGFDQIPERVKIVQEVFSRFEEGVSIDQIVRDLNARGIPSFTGKKFWPTTIRNLLTNPSVKGERHFKKVVNGKEVNTGEVAHQYPVIIEPDRFDRIQPRFRSEPGRKPVDPHYNLFNGLIFCGHCGGRVGMFNPAESKQYNCWGVRIGSCGGAGMDGKRVEKFVLRSCIQLARRWSASHGDAKKLETSEARLLQIQKGIANYDKAIAMTDDVIGIMEQRKVLVVERNRLENEIRVEQAKIAAQQIEFPEFMGRLEDKDFRLQLIPLIQRYVSKIELFFAGDRQTLDLYRKRLSDAGDRVGKLAVYNKLKRELRIPERQFIRMTLASGEVTCSVPLLLPADAAQYEFDKMQVAATDFLSGKESPLTLREFYDRFVSTTSPYIPKRYKEAYEKYLSEAKSGNQEPWATLGKQYPFLR